MPAAENAPVLKCDNILVSTRGITETHGKKILLFVPAPEISRLTLKFGRSDHCPVVSLAIGVLLSVLGIYGLVKLISAPRGFRYELGMITLGVIGGSMIFDTLKQRYFLEVTKPNGVSRLVFSKQTQLNDIREFCRQVGTTYNYAITEEF
jgi:hypothetical protein